MSRSTWAVIQGHEVDLFVSEGDADVVSIMFCRFLNTKDCEEGAAVSSKTQELKLEELWNGKKIFKFLVFLDPDI